MDCARFFLPQSLAAQHGAVRLGAAGHFLCKIHLEYPLTGAYGELQQRERVVQMARVGMEVVEAVIVAPTDVVQVSPATEMLVGACDRAENILGQNSRKRKTDTCQRRRPTPSQKRLTLRTSLKANPA